MTTFDKPFHARGDKLNPNTLLGVLWEVCRHRQFETYEQAADVLGAEADLSWKTSPLSFTGEVLRMVLTQRTPVKYWQLEAFARQAGVPTGFLLLFSRLRSNRNKGLIKENERMLGVLGEIARSTKPDDPFSIEMLYQWSNLLGTPPQTRQLSLDLK